MCQNDIWESLGGDVIFSCQWFAVHIQLFFPQLTAVIINTYSVYPFGRNIMIFDPTWMPCLVWMPKCLSLLFRLKEHNLSHSVCVCVCVCFFFFNRAVLLMKRMMIGQLQQPLVSTGLPSPASLIVSWTCRFSLFI